MNGTEGASQLSHPGAYRLPKPLEPDPGAGDEDEDDDGDDDDGAYMEATRCDRGCEPVHGLRGLRSRPLPPALASSEAAAAGEPNDNDAAWDRVSTGECGRYVETGASSSASSAASSSSRAAALAAACDGMRSSCSSVRELPRTMLDPSRGDTRVFPLDKLTDPT